MNENKQEDHGSSAELHNQTNNSGRSSGDYGLTTPIAPEGQPPVTTGGWTSDEDYGLTTPIAPEGSAPVAPNTGWPNTNWPGWNVIPLRPSYPGYPQTPIYPSYPSYPGQTSSYGQVRFLNASTNNFPVTFRIDGTDYAVGYQFGNISGYQQISDGFHTVTVLRTTGMQSMLLQQTFPFTANEKVTMVLVDAREGGLNLIQVSDSGCSNVPSGYGCYRVANMSYSGSNFDVRLANGDTVFRALSFTDVSSYKRAYAGSYTFYVTAAQFSGILRELPVIVLGTASGNTSAGTPLTSANVTISPGGRMTSYIIGNVWSSYTLRMLTVSD